MEKFAKIYRLGGEVKTFEVSQYETVEDAIKGTGHEVKDGEVVRLNGNEVDLDESIDDNDTITIVPQVKGGSRK
jgi:molybdopterin converting factor small subunit